MLVNVYLVGDYGILILIGAVIGAIWVGHILRSGMDEAQEAGVVPKVTPIGSPAPVMVGNADVVRPGAHHGSYLKRPDWLLSMIGEFLDAPIALCSETGPLLLRSSSVGVSGVPNSPALCLIQISQRWSNFIDYRFMSEAE